MKLDLRSPSYSRKPRIEMLPLIDIVFLLLVFFIYAMLSMAVHRGLAVALPSSSAAGLDSHQEIAITITDGGDLYLDELLIDPRELKAVLEAGPLSGKQKVLVFADRQVSYQELFNLLDLINAAGISEISLQAEAEGSP